MPGRKKVWPPRLQSHRGYARAKNPHTGQYVSFGKDGPEARQRYSDWLATLDRPAPIRVTLADHTVADVLRLWFADAQLSAKEVKNYRYAMDALTTTHGTMAARSFDVPSLKAHRKAILQTLSPRTANSRIRRIRTIWRWAEESRLVPVGAWQHLLSLRPLKTDPLPNRSVSLEDLEAVCRYLRPVAADMMRLQYWTGMRPGEVRQMTWAQIRDGIFYPDQHKGKHRGHVRGVVLGLEALAILENYQSVVGLIFTNRLGRPYTDEAYSRHISRGAKRAGIVLTPYSMRHAAKDRLTREYGLDVARAVLGQVSLGTTNQYGTAADMELAKKAIEQQRDAG